MSHPLPRHGSWRERAYPDQRWHRLFVRTIATADLTPPDGTEYRVVAHRLIWPRGGGVDTDTVLDLVQLVTLRATRLVWAVRVTTGRPRRPRQLVYGEEYGNRNEAVARARDIAGSLIETGEI